jgi:hypothetical protein
VDTLFKIRTEALVCEHVNFAMQPLKKVLRARGSNRGLSIEDWEVPSGELRAAELVTGLTAQWQQSF